MSDATDGYPNIRFGDLLPMNQDLLTHVALTTALVERGDARALEGCKTLGPLAEAVALALEGALLELEAVQRRFANAQRTRAEAVAELQKIGRRAFWAARVAE